MKTSGNTILITGGSAGIGFEIAKLLAPHNKLIITGRNEARLQQALAQLHNTTAIVSDVSKEQDVDNLTKRIKNEFPELNLLINNAGAAYAYQLTENANAYEKASEEMLTNYLSIIRLTEKLLPTLQQQEEAAIVNVSSIVSFVPGKSTPTYSASKAALHSYTQTLRLTLEQTGSAIQVFELMPPLVNTDFSQEIGGSQGIAPSVVAEDLIKGMENNEQEIKVGATAQLYQLFLSSPKEALLALNSTF